jgi:hypothetical protein
MLRNSIAGRTAWEYSASGRKGGLEFQKIPSSVLELTRLGRTDSAVSAFEGVEVHRRYSGRDGKKLSDEFTVADINRQFPPHVACIVGDLQTGTCALTQLWMFFFGGKLVFVNLVAA